MKAIINCKLKNAPAKDSVNYKNNLLNNKKAISKKQITIPAESKQSMLKPTKINKKFSIIRTKIKNKPKAVYESAGLSDLAYLFKQTICATNNM